MQIMNVNMISMNYENVYRYLCFCCTDAVDCGAGGMSCVGGCGLGWVASALPPLWIADQVRNDVTMRCIVLWIPAYAGMTGTVQYDGPG